MTAHIDAYALAAGHPPSASKRVLVDFDKTIRPWGGLFSWEPPLDRAVEAVQSLATAGFEVVILTSRMSPTWWRAEVARRGGSAELFGSEQQSYVYEYLMANNIPFDLITCEKMPALVLFDDTAIRVSPEYTLAQAVQDWLAAQ